MRRSLSALGYLPGPTWLAGVSLALLTCLTVVGCRSQPPDGSPIKVGLIAPLSGGSGSSGEAIQRGMLLAADEVNRDGGVLGGRLAIVTRDVQNDPSAGLVAFRELVDQDRIVAVFGGIFSPVMLGQLDAIHELRVPLINPWGSVTAITQNGHSPNFAFRVSASDEHADEFLARYTVEVLGKRRPAILADTTAWGDSNVRGLNDWLVRLGVSPAGVERFDQGDTDLRRPLEGLKAVSADVLLLVSPAPEGAAMVRGLVTLNWKVPVVSHWGISGGQFVEGAGVDNVEGIYTLQTYTFFGQQSAKGEELLKAYHARFGTRRVEDVLAPVGVAHGYDGMHLLARAIRRAGSVDGELVRDALEQLEPYDGLVKRYAPAFSPERHDALVADDYLMTVWSRGQLRPAPQPQLSR